MKNQYLDKKQNKRVRRIIILSIFIILFLTGLVGLSGQFFNYVGRPLWISSNFITKNIDNLGFLIKSKKSLFEENQKLRAQNLELELSHIDYQILETENFELKEIINRLPPTGNFILANILSKNNQSFYNTFIVDVGLLDEVEEGDLIYANGHIPIAKIEKVYKNSSSATLFSNPNQITEAFLDELNISLSLVGRGGGNFEAIVPVELSVLNEAKVYLPGNNSSVLATVDEIISEPADPHKKIILSSPINIQDLKWVEVRRN